MECDSELVTLALTDHSLVSWWLRNCWRNCLFLCKDITLFCSHIYKEGNSCADRLANHGASASTPFFFWDSTPNFIRIEYLRNKTSLPNCMFS